MERWLLACLCLWGAGVLANEALASVGLAGCAAAALVAAVRKAGASSARNFARAWAPLLAFVGFGLVGSALAGRFPSGTGVARLADWLGIPVAAWALARVGAARWRTLAYLVGAVFALSCAVAGFQHLGWWPGPEAFASLEWTRIPFYRVYEPVPGSPGRYMAGGLLSHRLKFAHVGGLAVAFALSLGLRWKGRDRALALGLAGVGFASVLLFPYARAAAGALALCCLGVLVAGLPRRLGLAAGAALILLSVGTVALYPPLRERFAGSLTTSGSGDRGELVLTGLRAIAAYPVAGVGQGQFRPAKFADGKAPPAVLENAGKAHNQFVTVAAEAGLVGLALFLWLLIWLARQMASNPGLGAAGLGGLAYFCLVGLTHDPLFQAPFSMALPLVLGASLARLPASQSSARR